MFVQCSNEDWSEQSALFSIAGDVTKYEVSGACSLECVFILEEGKLSARLVCCVCGV